MKRFFALGLALCLLTTPAFANNQTPRAPFSEVDLPDILKPWSKWVLSDYHANHCPFLYNNAAQKSCIWPSELSLKMKNDGAEFQLKAELYDEGWLTLPGTESRWPQHVKNAGQTLIVSNHEGRPAIFLQPGTYTITGNFEWNELPENLPLPQSLGLLHLEVAGQAVRFPSVDEANTLWVKRQETQSTEAERMDVKIFRHITDSIPTRITTRLMLHISGKPREVLLGNTMLEGFTPLSIESPIPARIEPDGALRLQVRPGTWQLDIQSRGTSALSELSLPTPTDDTSGKLMPREEIWVFQALNYLRIVQVEGASPIDPTQTELPPEWRNLPAYYMQPAKAIKLTEKKRGNSEPAPDEISMSKELWLDFDGIGYTVRDQINGNISQSWRLEVQPNIELGRAAISGHDQFITRLSADKTPGIEIRPGSLTLDADSRIENAQSELSATGWAHDVRSLSANLHLPAGWSLFYASGADSVSDSWIQRWTLLDVFMLVIVLVSIHRLYDLRTALISAPGFILLHHTLHDVTSISLLILAAIALLRVIPEGRFSMLITFARRMALLLLIMISLPFMISHMRLALFPQLGMIETYATKASGNISTRQNMPLKRMHANKAAMTEEAQVMASAPPVAAEAMDILSSSDSDMAVSSIAKEKRIDSGSGEYSPQQEIYQYDPSMQSNTGFGIANWQGRIINLRWNGPVLASQSIHLWLMSPTVNLLLSIIRILLLSYIILVLMGVRVSKDNFKHFPQHTMKAFAIALALWVSAPQTARAESDDIPPAPVLEEMKRKLIAAEEKPPTCLPQCTSLPRASIEANGEQLAISIEVHANENTMIPLPGPINSWRATDITLDQGAITPSLRSENDNYMYLAIDRGVHTIRLTGALPTTQDSVNLSFPLKPARIETTATGWDIQGLQPDGSYNGSLQLLFTGARAKSQEATLEKNHFSALVQVERTLSFGLSWQVETTVRRLSPAGESIAVQIPLLVGETVTSADMPVKDSKAYVSLSPNITERRWTSQLPASDAITLTAPKATDWPESISGNEIWRLNISNLWHVTFEGLPSVTLPQNAQTTYTNSGQTVQMPSFAPLPSESLTLHITRPEGVAGQTLTVDHSNLTVNAGSNALEATLELTLRASQGGQHTITLPESAIISSATLNGTPTSLSTKEGNVNLPLSPGSQTYTITWNQPTPMGMSYTLPAVNLHIASVNAESTINLPRDRWLLATHGPQMGPAILFWGWIPVVLLAAFALGHVTLTPLRFHQWLLLLLGLTQTGLMTNLIIIGWLLALGLRAKESNLKPTAFNIRQLVLSFWTLISLSTLFNGIRIGLLGSPDMRVQGNQSSSYMLRWYQDIASELLPQPSIFSLPLFCYRTLMLLWALWLAFALLKWLQWGWKCFATGGIWQAIGFWRKK